MPNVTEVTFIDVQCAHRFSISHGSMSQDIINIFMLTKEQTMGTFFVLQNLRNRISHQDV